MKTFEQLQMEKADRAAKLLELLPQFSAAEFHDADISSKISTLSDNLKSLLAKINEQKSVCSDEQCNSLLDQEIGALASRHKEINSTVIEHVSKAAKGKPLNIVPVREALIMIASRRDSLSKLNS